LGEETVIKNVVEAVKRALESMDKNYCRLSTLEYSEFGKLEEVKYLERPFAYEFYHQLRKLIDEGFVDLGGSIVQAEVDKRYQHIFEKGMIPDFIIHIPDTEQNLAVIGFKCIPNWRGKSDLNKIKEDFEKLLEFKKRPLNYEHLIEVIIGNGVSLEKAMEQIKELDKQGVKIAIIKFNTDSWKAELSEIRSGSEV